MKENVQRFVFGCMTTIVACLIHAPQNATAGLPDPSSFGVPIPSPGMPLGAPTPSVGPNCEPMVFTINVPHRVGTAELDDTGTWTNIQVLSLGSGGGGWEGLPTLSPDGQWLFYTASSGVNDGLIFRSVRQGDGTWGPGQPIQGAVNNNPIVPHPAAPMFNGTNLYFRNASGSVSDIWESVYDPLANSFGPPVKLNALINDGNYSDQPYVTPDGCTLLFGSDRAGTDDIWISSWNPQISDWDAPFPLNSPVNTNASETSPWFCSATNTLYFQRNGQIMESRADTPPAVACLVDHDTLWPPNRKLADVGLSVVVEDDIDPTPTVDVIVYSDEDDGAEPHSPDAVLDGESLLLRKERAGNSDGRVYLIVVVATDAAGNSNLDCCAVVVPHDRSRRSRTHVETQAAAAVLYCREFGEQPPGFVQVGGE